MRRLACAVLLVPLLVPSPTTAQGGRLERVREEVRREPSPGENRDDRSCDDEDGSGDFLGEVLGPLCVYTITGPFVLPHRFLEDDFARTGLFRRYPWDDGRRGRLTIQGAPEPSPHLRPWSVRLAVDESNDFHGLNRLTASLLVDTSSRFGLQTGWTHLREQLPGGRRDEMVLGDANLVFRFAQGEAAEFRAGLGGRLLLDGDLVRGGFNATYGADFFPAEPFIISTTFDAGTLGSAGVFRVRATAGVSFRHFELYAGYDYLLIGAVDLQGPVAGLRLWF